MPEQDLILHCTGKEQLNSPIKEWKGIWSSKNICNPVPISGPHPLPLPGFPGIISPSTSWASPPNCKMYLSKLLNAFVQITKCFVQIVKCICPNDQMYLSKIAKCIFKDSGPLSNPFFLVSQLRGLLSSWASPRSIPGASRGLSLPARVGASLRTQQW